MQRRGRGILLYYYVATLFFVVFLSCPNFTSATTNHIVISEVQISGVKATDDFVELYNPNNQEFPLDGYRLVKRTKTGTTDTTIKSFSSADKIPIYGFYLWANSDFTTISIVPDSTTSGSIASDNGIALRHGDENTGEIIDSVAWGAATNTFVEGTVFSTNPAAGKSVERKPGASNANKGNGEDTNNNANDFVLRDISEPQNKSSAIEVPDGIIWPPPNVAPTVNAGSDQTVYKNASVSFSSAGSSDSDGFILSYAWDFGDGSHSVEANPSHTYSTVGTYTVSLTVADDDGATSSDSCTINVADLLAYSQKVLINEFLPAPGSTHDWDSSGLADSNDEWIELINLDDGQIDLSGWILDDVADGGSDPYLIPANTKIDADGFKVFYKKDTGLVLNNTGDSVILKNPLGVIVDEYDFTNSVTDKSFSRNTNSAASTWTMDFPSSPGQLNTASLNEYPIANAGSSITGAEVGKNISFNASTSRDPDGSIVSYDWNFGDGQNGTGVQVNHVYTIPGTYQVSLTVRDNGGATSTATVTAAVVASTGPAPYQNQYSNNIKIIEIMPNPADSNSDEYIKIFNSDNKDLNLRNWIIDDEEGGSKPFLIDYDVLIKQNSSLNFSGADTKIVLNNDGDSARLFDPDKKLIDQVIYKENAPKGTPYILNNGKWVWKTGISQDSTPATDDKKTVPADSNPIETKAAPKETLPDKITIPDVKKIEITEPPIIVSPSLIAQNEIPKTQTIGEIITNSGTLIASVKEDATPLIQQDFDSSSLSGIPNVESKIYQKPAVVVSLVIFSLLLIAKILIRPDDWKNIFKKLFDQNKQVGDDFDNLFK